MTEEPKIIESADELETPDADDGDKAEAPEVDEPEDEE